MAPMHIGILYGGRSTEHEISILSARNIYKAIDKSKYDISLIRIDREGYWHLESTPDLLFLDDAENREKVNNVFLYPAHNTGHLLEIGWDGKNQRETLTARASEGKKFDVIFPVLHGTNGEDGTIQGLLKLVNIPFVGASVVGSVLGIDKDVMKRLLKEAGLPIPRFVVIRRNQRREVAFATLADELGLPFFIKPANAGSSVGISRVSSVEDFRRGLEDAFRFDNKVLVEENITGREIECAVIGNEHPMASVTGEIITQHAFYSYDAKYLDETGTVSVIPADIPDAISNTIRKLALEVYQTLCCEGMARIDVFLDKNENVIINEINTIPGFTTRSMFPLLWEHSGVSFSELIDKLIALSIERHKRDSGLMITK